MFTDVHPKTSLNFFKKSELQTSEISYIQEDDFWNIFVKLKEMRLCHPLILLKVPQGVFLCLKLLRPFLEYHFLVQTSEKHTFCKKLQSFFVKENSFIKNHFNLNIQHIQQEALLNKMQTLPPNMSLHWSSKIDPFEGVALSWALAGVYENAWQIVPPFKAILLRTFACELQRVLWGLQYLKGICQQLQWDFWKDLWLDYRECFFQIQELAFHHRIFPHFIVIGGVHQEINQGHQRLIEKYLLEITPSLSDHIRQFVEKTKYPLKDFLPLDRDELEKATWGGMVAKASQSFWDARLFASYGLEKYAPLLLPSNKPPLGDAFDRLQCVADNILYSLRHLTVLLFDLSKQSNAPLAIAICQEQMKDPKGCVFVVEGSSGPIYASVFNWQIDISTSRTRGYKYLPHFLSKIADKKIPLALASLGFFDRINKGEPL